MLDTLLKIGQWQSEGKSEWDRFLEFPKVETQDKRENKITNYTLPIIFDLDEKEVIIEKSNLQEYREKDVHNFFLFKTQRGNSKKIYSTVLGNKISNLFDCFCGGKEGHLLESIRKDTPSLLSEKIEDILKNIFSLKDDFHGKIFHEKKGLSIEKINEDFDLSKNEPIVFIFTKIKSLKHGYSELTLFNEIRDYHNFLIAKHFKTEDSKHEGSEKICYASGEIANDVTNLNLPKSFSLNKMFVTETKNYAPKFNEKNFNKSYQVSKANQEMLDYASDFLLHHGYTVQIANVGHVIIPNLSFDSNIDWEIALQGIKKKSDLLFHFSDLEQLSKDIEDEEEKIYWLNFIAYDSNGNFFKSTEAIKDVSNFHFNAIIKAFEEVDLDLKHSKLVDWDMLMFEYNNDTKEPIRAYLNFNSVYRLIPLRKKEDKKNKALNLFKTIFENRTVEANLLYDYFTELVLCHWFERYDGYINIPRSSRDYFFNSVRKSVFKYLAFIQVLKKLNLINMEENTSSNIGSQYDDAIEAFFEKMDIKNDKHKSMFYLGRILNRVEWIQFQKKIKKTVIHLVNFNGLDKDDIVRLYEDLFNKARQHSRIGDIKFLSGQFHDHFKYSDWEINPKEALFFLLCGYSFKVNPDEADKQTKIELEDATMT